MTEPLEKALLNALDLSAGGVGSANAEEFAVLLRVRGVPCDAERLRDSLAKLVRSRRVEAVTTEDRGIVYTRPDVLLRSPGVAVVRRGPPRG